MRKRPTSCRRVVSSGKVRLRYDNGLSCRRPGPPGRMPGRRAGEDREAACSAALDLYGLNSASSAP